MWLQGRAPARRHPRLRCPEGRETVVGKLEGPEGVDDDADGAVLRERQQAEAHLHLAGSTAGREPSSPLLSRLQHRGESEPAPSSREACSERVPVQGPTGVAHHQIDPGGRDALLDRELHSAGRPSGLGRIAEEVRESILQARPRRQDVHGAHRGLRQDACTRATGAPRLRERTLQHRTERDPGRIEPAASVRVEPLRTGPAGGQDVLLEAPQGLLPGLEPRAGDPETEGGETVPQVVHDRGRADPLLEQAPQSGPPPGTVHGLGDLLKGGTGRAGATWDHRERDELTACDLPVREAVALDRHPHVGPREERGRCRTGSRHAPSAPGVRSPTDPAGPQEHLKLGEEALRFPCRIPGDRFEVPSGGLGGLHSAIV